jgi:hypothetical protein
MRERRRQHLILDARRIHGYGLARIVDFGHDYSQWNFERQRICVHYGSGG